MVSRLPMSRSVELGAVLHEQLDDIVAAFVCGAHQRRATVDPVLRVQVGTEIQQHLHGLERLLGRPLVRDALHPADAARHHQGVTP